jgi:seryl-tRNA synthetase
LPEQAESVEEFKTRLRARASERSPLLLDGLCTHSATALCPTVCYHFYQTHAGQALSADALLTATALSPCYRYEGKAMRGLRRLREFTMREIIFLGEPALVQKRREALIDVQRILLELCQLHSAIRTASDPFFLDDYDKKRVFQMSFDLKHEVQAWLPEEQEWLAIGSVNHHQDHFGKAFDITLPGGVPAQSCCLGFGLDRWCMAIFAQHGLDPERWPEGVRAMLQAHRHHTAALKSAA